MSSLQKTWSYQCDCWLKNSDNGKIHVKFIKTNKYASKTLFLAIDNTEKKEETSLLMYCHMNKKN